MQDWIELSPYWVTEDRLVSADRFELWGFVPVASASNGTVSLYNDREANEQSLIGTFTVQAGLPPPVMFPRGVHLNRGLYVDIGTNMRGILIIGRPIFEPPG